MYTPGMLGSASCCRTSRLVDSVESALEILGGFYSHADFLRWHIDNGSILGKGLEGNYSILEGNKHKHMLTFLGAMQISLKDPVTNIQ